MNVVSNCAAALCNLGFAVGAQGDSARAEALLRESLDIYRELQNHLGIAECLVGRAQVSTTQGQPEAAARLLALAEMVHRSLPWPPSDRAEYERTVTSVRSLLGDEAFARAWTEGRTITPEQAVEYALKEDK